VIIQALLLPVLASILFYAISQRRRSRLLSAAMMIITLVGGVFVLFPGSTQAIANSVGIGRGADLVTYCFILVTLVAVFNLHLRLRASAELITELARAIALSTARADMPAGRE
jgi:small membrane protein